MSRSCTASRLRTSSSQPTVSTSVIRPSTSSSPVTAALSASSGEISRVRRSSTRCSRALSTKTHRSRSRSSPVWDCASWSSSAADSTSSPSATCQSNENSWPCVNADGRSDRGVSSRRTTADVDSSRTSSGGQRISMRLAISVGASERSPSRASSSGLTVAAPRVCGSRSRSAGDHHGSSRRSIAAVGSLASWPSGCVVEPANMSPASNAAHEPERGCTLRRTTAACSARGLLEERHHQGPRERRLALPGLLAPAVTRTAAAAASRPQRARRRRAP